MTVLENVVAPLPDARWRTMLADAVGGHEADRARELLDFVGLARFAEPAAPAPCRTGSRSWSSWPRC